MTRRSMMAILSGVPLRDTNDPKLPSDQAGLPKPATDLLEEMRRSHRWILCAFCDKWAPERDHEILVGHEVLWVGVLSYPYKNAAEEWWSRWMTFEGRESAIRTSAFLPLLQNKLIISRGSRFM